MRAKFNSFHRAVHRLFGTVVCAGAMLLMAASAPAQNLFVADSASNSIYEITPDGVQTTFASGLCYPAGLAFNNAGVLFESDSESSNIYEFTPSGVRGTFASGLYAPTALAFNSAGDLFVAAGPDGNIYKFTPDGVKSLFATGLISPFGLAFDQADNLFVSSDIIYKILPNGTQSVFASVPDGAIGLAFNGAGKLFVANFSGNIYEFTPDGTRSTFASVLPAGIQTLAINSAGDLFSSGYFSGTITEITPDGTQNAFANGLRLNIFLAFQPSPELMATVTNGVIQVAVSMRPPNYSTIVQVSTDMTNWTSVCTNTPPFTFTNSIDTTLPCRFYRALLGP